MSNNEELKEIFGSDNLVPLTDSVIEKLVEIFGMKLKDLKVLQKQGFSYSLSTNSFVTPLEFETDNEDLAKIFSSFS